MAAPTPRAAPVTIAMRSSSPNCARTSRREITSVMSTSMGHGEAGSLRRGRGPSSSRQSVDALVLERELQLDPVRQRLPLLHVHVLLDHPGDTEIAKALRR